METLVSVTILTDNMRNILTDAKIDVVCGIIIDNTASDSLSESAVDGIVDMLRYGLAMYAGLEYYHSQAGETTMVPSRINDISNALIESAVKSIELACKNNNCKYRFKFTDKTNVLF